MIFQASISGWENVYYLYAFYKGKSLIRNGKNDEAKNYLKKFIKNQMLSMQ